MRKLSSKEKLPGILSHAARQKNMYKMYEMKRTTSQSANIKTSKRQDRAANNGLEAADASVDMS
jgi:hypothetical protein